MSRASLFIASVIVLLLGSVQPASAQQIPGGGDWAPAADAAGDNTYEGFIDQPASGASIPVGQPFHVSGWVVDTTAEGWAGIDDLQVLLGSALLAHGAVGGNRPDVAAATGNPFWAASGFDAVVPIVAHTPGKGGWSKHVTITVSGSASATAALPASGLVLSINSPGPNEDVLANKNGVINGVAYDTRTRAELAGGVDRVQVYLDGPRGVAGSQFLGEASGFTQTWSLSWEPTRYDTVRHHVLFVYARSAVTGEERLMNQEFNIVH
jgi:hypothetical protein